MSLPVFLLNAYVSIQDFILNYFAAKLSTRDLPKETPGFHFFPLHNQPKPNRSFHSARKGRPDESGRYITI
jgi:hypothetical protein